MPVGTVQPFLAGARDGAFPLKTYEVASAVAVVSITPLDVQRAQEYKNVAVLVQGLALETVSILGSMDNTGFTNNSAALRPIDGATGALTASSALGNGTYIFRDWPFNGLRFTKSAGVDSVTIRVVMSNG